jgi:hypothetical protein
VNSTAVHLGVDPLVERERNRLLRRVDWRFLGGTPINAISVCFTDGALARAVRAVSSQVLDVDRAVTEGRCDVAVAVDPDAETLRRAWAALRPGGTCYVEWRQLRAGGPWGLRHRLAGAGFVDVACYAPRPDPVVATPRQWIPLDSTAATRRFVRAQSRASTTLPRRVARAARGVLWSLGPPARFSRPLCTVARKPVTSDRRLSAISPTNNHSDFSADLTATLRDQWHAWNLGAPPTTVRLQLQTSGPRSVSKVIALVFADQQPDPALVVKLPRVRESIAPLRTEAAALRAIDGHAGTPRLLFARTLAGVFTVGESVVTGTPLVAMGRPPKFEAYAAKATEWIAQLGHGAIRSPRSEYFGRLVESPLADFVTCFGRVLDHGLVRETEARLQGLDTLPIVCEHRDFSPWNVLIAPSGSLGVLDWEGAELRGLPALDLIYFLTYWSFFLDGADHLPTRVTSYRTSLDPSTRSGAVTRECLVRYCERLGISAAELESLRVLVWLLHARSEYRRLVEDAGGRPTDDQLARSLFVSLWRAELRDGRQW